MDFFQHQERARRITGRLVFLYLCALFCITLALFAPIGLMVAHNNGLLDGTAAPSGSETVPSTTGSYGYGDADDPYGGDDAYNAYGTYSPQDSYAPDRTFTGDPVMDLVVVFLIVAGVVVLIVGGGSLYKTAELSQGGGRAVAEMLGGRAVNPDTRDLAERRLLNVIEEVAIASGVSVPTVYIMDNEDSINAFAAGYSPNEAVVAVTRGTMSLLSRDELQGVVAHEFSHILNGDMRLNIRLIGTLFGLEMLVMIGYFLLRLGYFSNAGYDSRSSNGNNNSAAAVVLAMAAFGLLVVLIGSIGMFFSAVIKAAISRQREFLADASAVQFTRHSAGIAGALKKIGSPHIGSAVGNPHAMEASHMFFESPFSSSFMQHLFATHPDLTTRIKRLDPSFDGKFPARVDPVRIEAEPSPSRAPQSRKTVPLPFPIPGVPTSFPRTSMPGTPALATNAPTAAMGLAAASTLSMPDAPPVPTETAPVSSRSFMQRVGRLDDEAIRQSTAALEALPAELAEACRDPLGAKAVAYAVLIDPDMDIAKKQLLALANAETTACYGMVVRFVAQVKLLSRNARLTLVRTTFPALHRLSRDQYRRFRQLLERLIVADLRVDLFEYAVKALLEHDLDPHFGLARRQETRYTSVGELREPLIYLLSYLAYSGHTDMLEARKAFSDGMVALNLSGEIVDPARCDLDGFDKALRQLDLASPPVKQKTLEAVLACVSSDGKIVQREEDLVQAICAVIGIPVPAEAIRTAS